jgi:hypothetical protein
VGAARVTEQSVTEAGGQDHSKRTDLGEHCSLVAKNAKGYFTFEPFYHELAGLSSTDESLFGASAIYLLPQPSPLRLTR